MPVARFVRRLRIGEEKSDLRYSNIGQRDLAVHYGKGCTLSDNAEIAVTEHRIGTLSSSSVPICGHLPRFYNCTAS